MLAFAIIVANAGNRKVTIVVIPGILQVNVESRKSPKHKHKPTQTNINQIDNTAEKGDDEESVNYITSCQQL